MKGNCGVIIGDGKVIFIMEDGWVNGEVIIFNDLKIVYIFCLEIVIIWLFEFGFKFFKWMLNSIYIFYLESGFWIWGIILWGYDLTGVIYVLKWFICFG